MSEIIALNEFGVTAMFQSKGSVFNGARNDSICVPLLKSNANTTTINTATVALKIENAKSNLFRV